MMVLIPIEQGVNSPKKVVLYMGLPDTLDPLEQKKEVERFLAKEVTQRYDGFTFQWGTGYFKGEKETCIILTILVEKFVLGVDTNRIATIARKFRQQFKQESVLLEVSNISYGMLKEPKVQDIEKDEGD